MRANNSSYFVRTYDGCTRCLWSLEFKYSKLIKRSIFFTFCGQSHLSHIQDESETKRIAC